MTEQQASAETETSHQQVDYGRGLWVSLKFDFRTRLLLSLYSLARLLHIMPSSADADFDERHREFGNLRGSPGYKDVDSYRTALLNLYLTEDVDQERWKVYHVETYKTNASTKHEYLLATLKSITSDTVYMRIERILRASKIKEAFSPRQPGPSKPAAETPPSSDTDRPPPPQADMPSTSEVTTPQDTASFSKKASDEVKFMTSLNIKRHQLVDKIDFPEGIPLPRLAILAHLVNIHGAEYHVLRQNCYWFAHVMAEALKRLNPVHTVVPTQHNEKKGTWGWFHIAGEGSMFGGSTEMIERVVATFDDKLKEFDDAIDRGVNNPRSRLLKEEQRKREEEQRKREEADRKLEEEKRKREEEQRKHEEEQRKAEEKIARLEALLAERNANDARST